MKPVIIVEGYTDQAILRKLLPARLLGQVSFIIGGGRSNAESLAKTILVTKKQAIVLILDTDIIQEKVSFFDWYFGQAGNEVPYKVLLMQPEIETILFYNRELLETLLEYQFTDMEWELALAQPAKVLYSLSNKSEGKLPSLSAMLSKMDSHAIELLQSHPLIQELVEFLDEVIIKTES